MYISFLTMTKENRVKYVCKLEQKYSHNFLTVKNRDLIVL